MTSNIELYVSSRLRQKELENQLINDRIHLQLIKSKKEFEKSKEEFEKTEAELKRRKKLYSRAVQAWNNSPLNEELSQTYQESERLKLLVEGKSNSEAQSSSDLRTSQSFTSSSFSFPFIVPLLGDNEHESESDLETDLLSNNQIDSHPLFDTTTIESILKSWPLILKTFANFLNPARSGACPHHTVKKMKCEGRSCDWWKNLMTDLNRDPDSRTPGLNQIEHGLQAQRYYNKTRYQRKKHQIEQVSDDDHSQQPEDDHRKETSEVTHDSVNTINRRQKQKIQQTTGGQQQKISQNPDNQISPEQ